MLVHVLGAVELVASGGETVPLPGSRQPALLAALAARANEVVSADRLVGLLWEGDLPANPEAALYSAVHKLRSSLRSACGHDVLRTRDHGYQLTLSPGDLDATLFCDLLAEAAHQPPGEAAGTLAQALSLWRGRAYGDFADTPVAQLEAMRLEEARRSAVERLAEALLAAGRSAEVVPLLEPFVVEHPLRETARATLMRALHETGRTAEALNHYQGYRHQIGEELGLEPSRGMQALQVELLQQPEVPAQRSSERAAAGPVRATAEAALPRGLPGLRVRYTRTGAGDVMALGTTGTGPPGRRAARLDLEPRRHRLWP